MRYIQFVFSPTGGTAKAANIITSQWDSSVTTVDLTDPACMSSDCDVSEDDLVLIAVPSYGGRVPALAAKKLSEIKGNSAKCVLLCVYGNRAYEDTLIELSDIAISCGFTIIAAVSAIAEHSIIHKYATGRPDNEDARLLKEYADKIVEKFQSKTIDSDLKLPGNRPYKRLGAGLIPRAGKRCIGCEICAKQCPAQAISLNNPKETDSKKCISCMRCVTNCPHNARKISSAMVSVASLTIKKACTVRKECELFI